MAKFGSVHIKPDRMKTLAARIKKMTDKRVFVGIPSSAADRGDGSVVNNAEIGFINEFGEPSMNIPARPHLVPGIRRVDGKITNILRDGGERVLSDDSYEVTDALEKAGLVGVSSVKELIMNGLAPPLSPRTLAARQKGSEDRTGDLPLIDTGNYLAHITYVVRDKKDEK